MGKGTGEEGGKLFQGRSLKGSRRNRHRIGKKRKRLEKVHNLDREKEQEKEGRIVLRKRFEGKLEK